MPIHTAVSRLASTIRRRVRPAAPAVEIPAPAPGAVDPAAEALAAAFRERIEARMSRPEDAVFLASDLNHIRRYVLSLGWIPDGEGLLLDPAQGSGYFLDVLRRERRYSVATPDYYNLEKTPAPYPNETFDGVLLMEVLEHFTADPMYALAELNRVLKPGGFLFLTTPNLASWLALHNLIHYRSPYLYGIFIRQGDTDRHNREYTVDEVGRLVAAAGFRVERLEGLGAYPGHDGLPPLPGINPANRGDTTFCLARKEGAVRDRYPEWLYATW